jgi:hypothetical protein
MEYESMRPLRNEEAVLRRDDNTVNVRSARALDIATGLAIQARHMITIHTLDHGYQVVVGCQTVAIESTEKLLSKLKQYLENPKEAEKLHNQGKFL